MNKTAIKNFAIWARNKLIADVRYQAGLIGITENGISNKLPQSVAMTEFYDIGTDTPYQITGDAIKQRDNLVRLLNNKASESNYKTAYKYILEEVAYSWFNRLIAIRFMEVNDYLPGHIRVLSSESDGKLEPDIVSDPFNSNLSFSQQEVSSITEMKQNNNLDGLFKVLFIKTCNSLNSILPGLFEKTDDYTELLLNLSIVDQDGLVSRLIHDIPEEDFDVSHGGQVEIIGWLYQYYNTEPKNEAFAKTGKTTKDEIPAVTQLFTPDWIVRYMVENSLGRLWIDGHPNNRLRETWKYYLDEAEQKPEVQDQLEMMHKEHAKLAPEDIKLIDPCMGSGHILVYAFDVLMQIYESSGYSKRDAAIMILENNIYGLDIDDRAYQLAYFAVMMKARQYNRRVFTENVKCHVYSIQESNGITTASLHDMGVDLAEDEYDAAVNQMMRLIEEFHDAKEYGTILNITPCDWDLLRRFAIPGSETGKGQIALDMHGEHVAAERLQNLIDIAEVMSLKYDIAVTNPPYMAPTPKQKAFVEKDYPNSKADLYAVFMEKSLLMLKKTGFVSMVVQQTFLSNPSFMKLRDNVINNKILNLIQIGFNSFPELNSKIALAAALTMRAVSFNYYKAKFLDLNTNYPPSSDKDAAFISERGKPYVVMNEDFINVPNHAIAYSFSKKVLDAFSCSRIENYVVSDGQTKTGDNDSYIRNTWEISFDAIGKGRKWSLVAKGGDSRKWYGNISNVIDWSDIARIHYKEDHVARIAPEYIWYRPGICWNHISTSKGFAVRLLTDNCLFETASPAVLVDEPETLLLIMSFLNTPITRMMMEKLSPGVCKNVGDVTELPLIASSQNKNESICDKTRECITYSKDDWDSFEISIDFAIHPLLGGNTMGRLIADKYKEWEDECNERFNQLKANEEEINRIFIDIYGLQDELTPEVEDKDVTVRKADLKRDIKSLLSYAVGCMFGRYSLDVEGLAYAGGEWDESKYQSFIPDKDNVIPITDEEYLEDDIVARLVAWLKVVYGEDTLEQNLDFIANALGNKGDSSRAVIRNYFLNDFFNDHCQTYSVTGSGKRPIYWLFDSGKQNGFKALIYLHRYNADTIGNLRVDYLHRIQRIYESEIARMQDTIDNSTNNRDIAQATKRKEKLTKQLKECREYDEKIGHLALSRIELDLDDGVKVNYKKLQTANDGLFYEVLANSKNIMVKEK